MPAEIHHRHFRFPIAALAVAAIASLGCANIDALDEQEEKTIVVPSADTAAPEYHGDGSIPRDRYVVRMSDGQRDWEVEFPGGARGYQLQIPLRGDSGAPYVDHRAKTPADRELLEHLRRTDPDYEREGIYRGDEHVLDDPSEIDAPDEADERSEADPAPTRPSYLRGIDEVRTLYQAGRHEAAMSHLGELNEAYPNDERILSMKGTLWLEMGRESLARDAWEQVLQINPDNDSVREALRRLEGTQPAEPAEPDDEFLE